MQQQCDRAHMAYSQFDLPVLCVGPLWFQSRAPRRQTAGDPQGFYYVSQKITHLP